jgi:hypothetical protein
VNLLWAPFYNVAHNEVYKQDGVWRTDTAECRPWKKAYGVTVNVLHAAMFWQIYPAFVSELRRPVTMDIWRLKQACEAELQWMSRTGRIIRMLLNQSRRKLRYDFPLVLRNYYMRVRRPAFEDAPILPLCLSAMNTFKDHLVFGRRSTVTAAPNTVFRRSVTLLSDGDAAAAAYELGCNANVGVDVGTDVDDDAFDAAAAASADVFGYGGQDHDHEDDASAFASASAPVLQPQLQKARKARKTRKTKATPRAESTRPQKRTRCV